MANKSTSRKRGRPTKYTDELAAEILAAIATTNKGLAPLCEENPHWPNPVTIYRWLLDNEDFCKRYARAKEDQTQVLEDEIIAIADTPQEGQIVTIRDGKKEVKRADMIEHRKLRIESRKWLMGKLKPKKYGDKAAVELTGKDGAPLHLGQRSDEELKFFVEHGDWPENMQVAGSA